MGNIVDLEDNAKASVHVLFFGTEDLLYLGLLGQNRVGVQVSEQCGTTVVGIACQEGSSDSFKLIVELIEVVLREVDGLILRSLQERVGLFGAVDGHESPRQLLLVGGGRGVYC